jgi:hypothetical protein
MTEVKTLDEAMNFFLSNSYNRCIGINSSGDRKELDCFPEAKEFFKENEK